MQIRIAGKKTCDETTSCYIAVPMQKRLLTVLLLMGSAACRCDGGPATGECTGRWAGVNISSKIDPESQFLIVYPNTCSGVSTRMYDIKYTSSVSLTFQPKSYPSILTGEISQKVPADFSAFSVTPNVSGTTGTIKLSLEGIYGRRTGTIALTANAGNQADAGVQADGGIQIDTLNCTFNVPYRTEGSRPSCGGGSSGGYDFD